MGSCVLLVLTLAGCARQEGENRAENTVTLYPASAVITLDRKLPRAEAVAVKGKQIVGVGTLASLREQLAGAQVEVDQRFADKVIVPGFINQHDHPWLAALTLATDVVSIEDWSMPGVFHPRAETQQAYRARLREIVATKTDPEQVIFSWGYHRLWHGELSRADLDVISSEFPIVIWQRSAHEFVFNSRALEYFDITPATLSAWSRYAQQQSNIQRGHFWEQGALALAPILFRELAAPERYLPALEMVKAYWQAAGSTYVVEPGGMVNRNLQIMQNQIFAPAATPFHMDYIADGKTFSTQFSGEQMVLETEKMLAWGEGMSRFLPKQVKLFADGAMFSQLMQMQDGYLDGHHGEWLMQPKRFKKAFADYWDAGYQIHVHQNGDLGLELLLDVVAENMRRNPRPDHRTVIVHFGFSTSDQIQRIRDLGLIVSANPYYPVVLADHYSLRGIGPARAQQMVRLGEVADAGVSFSLHSDMPMAPGKPLFLMWSAVNRVTQQGNLVGPEQRISVEQALRAVTIDAAYSLQQEHSIGSIEVGKLANLTILDADPLTVAPMAIRDIKVWGTVHEGRVFAATDKVAEVSVWRIAATYLQMLWAGLFD
ncbi:MAG: amidohydrolase [Candidatus Pelagadaptatus aseana]